MRLFVFWIFQVQGGERGPRHSWGLPHSSQMHVMVLNKKQACMGHPPRKEFAHYWKLNQ